MESTLMTAIQQHQQQTQQNPTIFSPQRRKPQWSMPAAKQTNLVMILKRVAFNWYHYVLTNVVK